jgi:hypothetical protein
MSEQHKQEVLAECDRILAHRRLGNPPELQAQHNAIHSTGYAVALAEGILY